MERDCKWTEVAIQRLEDLYAYAPAEKLDFRLKVIHELHSIQGLHSGGGIDFVETASTEAEPKEFDPETLNRDVGKILGVPQHPGPPPVTDPEDIHG